MGSRLATDYSHFDTSQFPAFTSYPYLVIRLIPSLHHIILLPDALDVDTLLEIGRRQAKQNALETCVVFDSATCVYFAEDGRPGYSENIPKGAFVEADKLKLLEKFPQSDELSKRQKLLAEYKASINGQESWYLIADPKKGGHFVSEDDLWQLKGLQWNGIPKGLEQCLSCEEWKGECIDPSSQIESLVVKVDCVCANNNICVRCGEKLYGRKLNANYFKDGEIWHVPGFVALDHKCEE